ncbi:hypothetical protein ACEYYB_04350 [Paracoccus sp. p4-l81]|uniref:hypothetical protein n=1 Tax=Paracoccus sp. p4-l81 TaxID=3342806 RepID=UPI0035B77D52
MSLIRPELREAAHRWIETLCAVAAMVFGLWVALRGGWVLAVLGAILLFLAAQWAWMAWRRARFAQAPATPGLVEVDEGAIRYLAPRGAVLGGTIALRDLVQIRLITVAAGRLWQLKQADGQMLLIPVDAQGADSLFDAFASLPGIDMGAVLAALNAPRAPGLRPLWQRR